jgi:hypothetical protein
MLVAVFQIIQIVGRYMLTAIRSILSSEQSTVTAVSTLRGTCFRVRRNVPGTYLTLGKAYGLSSAFIRANELQIFISCQ